ncbi:hypothetical protein SORBI_3003G375600 [Sorghum bicolor]|uniref:Uncharacterized protein n=1 Tax=Sorghum bicolor TaxID=4558 RepID=A0A1B6Q7B3_SORBI|nr:hypothetical protein SORBI_3003G375600 [Sorghum bicolor]
MQLAGQGYQEANVEAGPTCSDAAAARGENPRHGTTRSEPIVFITANHNWFPPSVTAPCATPSRCSPRLIGSQEAIALIGSGERCGLGPEAGASSSSRLPQGRWLGSSAPWWLQP